MFFSLYRYTPSHIGSSMLLKIDTGITPKLLDPQKSMTPQSEAEDKPHTLRGMGMPGGPSPGGWVVSLGQGSKTRKPSVTPTQQNFEAL